MAMVKCNFMMSEDVKAWYKDEAEKVGLSMSGLMSFVLAQYKKNEESRQVLAELNNANKNIDMAGLNELLKLIREDNEESAKG